MKLAPVLAQYLSIHKKLSLRGIGVFHSAPSASIETSSKNTKFPAENISFNSDPSAGDEPELIQFISQQTGKMKALASSDLEFYIELIQQFLNIGKPFQIEGIGTLTKTKQGVYEFTAGQMQSEKLTDLAVKESAVTDDLGSFKQTYTKQPKAGFTLTKSLIALLLFGGIAFAIWGGYTLYNRNRNISSSNENTSGIVPLEDTATAVVYKPVNDTIKKMEMPVTAPGYKFIFETTQSKKRAINRYNFLKKINSRIQLETTDSTLFNITVNMDIPASDTTRIKDSLNAWYYGKKDILVKIASPATNANIP